MESQRFRLVFDALALMVFAGAAVIALGFPTLALYFPLTVGAVGAGLAALNLGVDAWKMHRNNARDRQESADVPSTPDPPGEGRGVLYYSAWILLFVFMLLAAGLEFTAWLYLYLFLTVEARASLRLRLLAPTVVVAVLIALETFVTTLVWPNSLIVAA